ncbi:hypothetical protein [Clostridium sp. DL1XJH146]
MSKINRIRFINLNYNNNNMKIDDENYYLEGDNTLLNLRNGGGKSVLVQMMMAPFLTGRHRNLKDRTFDSYFTTSTPTFILVEWILEDGAGYLLNGMMVRKKISTSDEDSRSKLDIINFIHEYKDKNENDINNIPIIEEKNNGKVIKSFANAKKIFEDLKKKEDIKFSYYDMNNSVTSRAYFSKLGEYKINYREWETIIKKINLKESGLSELFTKAKSSEGLVKDWFLPSIENKLSKEEDRIKKFAQLLDGYIKQYKKNKNNIDKKKKIELFNELSEEVFTALDDFLNSIDNKENIENTIANVMEFLKESIDKGELKLKEIESDIQDLYDKVKELQYEKLSKDIHEKQNYVDELEEDRQKQMNLLSDSEETLHRLKKSLHILSCAKLHKEYKESSEELQSLEYELEALFKKNEDVTPRINDLAYTIKEILKNELIKIKEEENNKIQIKKSLLQEKESTQGLLKENRNKAVNLSKQQGTLNTLVKGYSKEENKFNKDYGENLYRNIAGFLDEEIIIKFENKINNEEINLNKERKKQGELLQNKTEELKSKKREKENNSKELNSTEYKLEYKNKELIVINEEIEKRKQVIKYIDFEEDKVFETNDIAEAFERKINILKDNEIKIRRISDKAEEELRRLEGGKVIELPKEIIEYFKKKDINIIYGMEWLKKNGLSFEENDEYVKKNPFIPYSIILDSREIDILNKEPIDVFTSFPIPIIKREVLRDNLKKRAEGLLDLNNVKFLIAFNNRLLNEKELQKLIQHKKNELDKSKDDIISKEVDIKFYDDKKNFIKKFTITFKDYEDLNKDIMELREKKDKLRVLEISLEKELATCDNVIENTKEEIISIEKKIEKSKKEKEDFVNLKREYEEYKKNKENLIKIEERIKINVDSIEKEQKRVEIIEKELTECEERIRYYGSENSRISNELLEFQVYKTGSLIDKDKEDLLSEYRSLRKEIDSSEEELKQGIEKATKKFNQVENELTHRVQEYKLEEKEYTTIIYDYYKETEIENNKTKEEETLNNLKDGIREIKSQLTIANDELKKFYEKLKSKFEKEEPKDRNLIYEKNYFEEETKLKIQIEEKTKEKKVVIGLNGNINSNLNNLSEYNNLEIKEEVQLEIDLNNLNETVGKLKRDLTNVKSEEIMKESNLQKKMFGIRNKEEFRREDFFEKPIENLINLVPKPREFKEQLLMIQDSYNKLIGKIAYDLELIESEEENILENLLEYIKDIHENIGKIDSNSTITIHSKRVKMLNITTTDWEENKEVYKIRLKDYIEQLRNQCIVTLEKNENIEDIIGNNINIIKLYDEVVSISSINIKLYKIEEDKQRQISWNDVSKNSGGEGFLSAFVILSSLMSYMRKDESSIFSRKEEGKVLIMDNPFAQTSSAHLLKPLIDIAKKSNTQLICLSGLGGDSIYNRFDNIYVLNLVQSKLRSGTQYLVSDHVKGDDETEVIVSSRLKIEEEQIRLF